MAGSRFDLLLHYILVAFYGLQLCVSDSDSPSRCDVCRTVVRSFKAGLERTSRLNFAGGNTAWEDEKLGKYATSEARFVEITEGMCGSDDVDSMKMMTKASVATDKCHSFVEEYEELLENWFFHKQNTNPDLFKWFCVTTVKFCCEENRFGPDCTPCLGDIDRPCFGNGKCDGAGDRSGTGKCICKPGYVGKSCRLCDRNYFASFQNDTHTVCEACHPACRTGCSGTTSSQCVDCKPGWKLIAEKGCEDVDECQLLPCKNPHEVCVNSIGSYNCVCETGYKNESGICLPDISVAERRPVVFGLFAEQVLRAMAYFGLAVSCIVVMMRPNIALFSVLALTLIIVVCIEFGYLNQYLPLRNVTSKAEL